MPYLWIVLIGIAVILLIWIIAAYNGLQKGKIKVEEAESGIDVALTKRYDVLTKMVDTVKGYMKHEQETLEKIVAMRNINFRNSSIEEKQAIAQQMDEAVRAINVVVEQYPDLKANQNFTHLQSSITDVEEHLQAARRLYNANVSSYNQKVKLFPSSIVANLFNFGVIEFFETEDFKRQDVEIKF